MPGFIVQDIGFDAPADPLLYYRYTWEVTNIFEEIVGFGSSGNVLLYARDATTPSYSFEKEEIQGASFKYKYAKNVVWDDVKITWYDVDGLWRKMKIWRDRIWTIKSGMGFANDYKRESMLRSYVADESLGVRWTLHNSWPLAVKTGELTYTGSDIKTVDVTISYDWAQEEESRSVDA